MKSIGRNTTYKDFWLFAVLLALIAISGELSYQDECGFILADYGVINE